MLKRVFYKVWEKLEVEVNIQIWGGFGDGEIWMYTFLLKLVELDLLELYIETNFILTSSYLFM